MRALLGSESITHFNAKILIIILILMMMMMIMTLYKECANCMVIISAFLSDGGMF